MVPTRRPSAKTSIFAPTRWGVDPRVETIVTRAAASPRSSASATAAKTSRFTGRLYGAGGAGGAGRAVVALVGSELMEGAVLRGLCALDKHFGHHLRAGGRHQLAGCRVDVGHRDALRRFEGDVRAAAER